MANKTRSSAPRPLVGLAAGVAAGLAASAVMALFQAKTAKAFDAEGDPADSATAKAANAAKLLATGEPMRRIDRPAGGQVVHYVFGAALGGAYGLAAEYRPGIATGFGSAYGLLTSAVFDEAAVPALGFGDAPTETPLGVHLYGVSSHLVYGLALEGVRALLGGRRA
ncbi:DUF1440 domain-containing protein [Sphingomonas donggukensis]|uniref:DUF1440 domain-containing protein n=1 Tax=Sphingomonas donggukensis TaxID=2949093 RepID=A0ABY4TZE6_9SPHN|nr:DUF1440 domain-containing protein [Sphingomonas donggukensis]URW75921.1 DUF1440 domain-containing protein [Sphingomonas donggukensis]